MARQWWTPINRWNIRGNTQEHQYRQTFERIQFMSGTDAEGFLWNLRPPTTIVNTHLGHFKTTAIAYCGIRFVEDRHSKNKKLMDTLLEWNDNVEEPCVPTFYRIYGCIGVKTAPLCVLDSVPHSKKQIHRVGEARRRSKAIESLSVSYRTRRSPETRTFPVRHLAAPMPISASALHSTLDKPPKSVSLLKCYCAFLTGKNTPQLSETIILSCLQLIICFGGHSTFVLHPGDTWAPCIAFIVL